MRGMVGGGMAGGMIGGGYCCSSVKKETKREKKH